LFVVVLGWRKLNPSVLTPDQMFIYFTLILSFYATSQPCNYILVLVVRVYLSWDSQNSTFQDFCYSLETTHWQTHLICLHIFNFQNTINSFFFSFFLIFKVNSWKTFAMLVSSKKHFKLSKVFPFEYCISFSTKNSLLLLTLGRILNVWQRPTMVLW